MIFASFVDRTNLSYAALEMRPALGLNASVFGFGAGILSAGEALFTVPSTLAARRLGVHRWIPVMMIIAWGLAAAAIALADGPISFHITRFLLGAIEAGVMPCLFLAAAAWWPPSHRARAITVITAASGVAIALGAPLGALISHLRGTLAVGGWQWMFLLEGLPVSAAGVAALFVFPKAPAEVRWLGEGEKAWLGAAQTAAPVDGARTARSGARGPHAGATGYVAAAALVNFCVAGVASTLVFWIPQVAREGPGLGPDQISRVVGPLFLGGILGSYWLSRTSDRAGRRYPFILACAGTGLVPVAAAASGPAGHAFALMALAFVIIRAIGGVFMAALSEGLSGRAPASPWPLP